MKKYLLGTLAIGGMLFAASCSNEEFDSPSGNDAKVTFTLNVEDGVQTRAISDGKSADKLVYAVFDSEGNQIQTIQQVTKTGVTFPATETITLAKGQKYTVVFWAQDADCAAYNTDNLKDVTVDYNGMNNDETRDAFFKAETFTVTGSTSVSVVMKRPFAQINVGVYQEDWDAAVASGINITKSSAVITNAATNINLLTGQVSGEDYVTFSAYYGDETTIDIPENYNGLPVTALGGYLFNERPVTSVSLPNSLKTIGNRSFRKCTELKSVNLPESLEIIGTGAFQGSGLTGKVVIPSSVKEIRENAFYEAKNITEINIPEGITTIAKNSFRAIGITEINIPLSVTSIGEYAFRDSKQFATINYGGTKIQWESITKGNGWALIAAQPFCDLTVKCTDGEIIIKRP